MNCPTVLEDGILPEPYLHRNKDSGYLLHTAARVPQSEHPLFWMLFKKHLSLISPYPHPHLRGWLPLPSNCRVGRSKTLTHPYVGA